MNNKKDKIPYIICAAIWFDNGLKYSHQPKNIKSGLVVCGRRHHNCLQIAFSLNENEKIKTEKRPIQGFLTSDDYFVDREKVAYIAYKAEQTKKSENPFF